MEIIWYRSKYKAWQFGIVHYVLYDWNKYYSWEYDISILSFKNWHFKIYEKIDGECIQIVSREYIPYIDMNKYRNLKKNGYNCMEIIYYIIKKENMTKVPRMVSTIDKTLIISIIAILYTILIVWISFVCWVMYSYNNLTITEEEYIQDPNNINF